MIRLLSGYSGGDSDLNSAEEVFFFIHIFEPRSRDKVED